MNAWLLSPLRGFSFFAVVTQGLRPGLDSFAASRLELQVLCCGRGAILKVSRLTFLLFLLLAGLPEFLLAQTEYFPKGALDNKEDSDRFVREWYSKHLKAMKEPSLWEMSKDKQAQVYRFLYLRTFDHPIAVRAELNKDGNGILVTKILSGQGGYEPGRLIKNSRRKLSKLEVENLLGLFADQEFWSTPGYPRQPPEIVGLDGAEWITEGVKDSKYHVVTRWSPEYGRERAFGHLFLFVLAKLKLLYMEVY